MNKNLTKILTESASYVQTVTGDSNILTKKGYEHLIADANATKDYIHRLTEGFTADQRAVLAPLMEQTVKQSILQESYDTLSPFQALSLPLLRVLWPYNSMKDGIQTIVADAPTFMITSKHYYLVKTIDNKKVRLELPKNSAVIAESPNGQKARGTVTGNIVNSAGVINVTGLPINLIVDETGAAATNLTTDLQLVELTFGEFPVAIPKHGWNTGGNIVVTFEDQQIAGGEEAGTGTADLFLNGTMFLLPNLEEGTVQAIFTGVVREVLHGTAAAGEGLALLEGEMKGLITASVTEKWNENQ